MGSVFAEHSLDSLKMNRMQGCLSLEQRFGSAPGKSRYTSRSVLEIFPGSDENFPKCLNSGGLCTSSSCFLHSSSFWWKKMTNNLIFLMRSKFCPLGRFLSSRTRLECLNCFMLGEQRYLIGGQLSLLLFTQNALPNVFFAQVIRASEQFEVSILYLSYCKACCG